MKFHNDGKKFHNDGKKSHKDIGMKSHNGGMKSHNNMGGNLIMAPYITLKISWGTQNFIKKNIIP